MGGPGDTETTPGSDVFVADLTPADLFGHVIDACTRSPVVQAYTLRTLEADILSMRVHLSDGSFIPLSFEAFLDEVSALRFPV